jgi:hypothetical protein
MLLNESGMPMIYGKKKLSVSGFNVVTNAAFRKTLMYVCRVKVINYGQFSKIQFYDLELQHNAVKIYNRQLT